MNGMEALPPIMQINPVVDMLEKLMADAKAGRINTLGIIAATPNGQVVTMFAGPRNLDLIGGTVILQHQLMQAIGQAASGRPAIIPARMG